MLSLENMIKLLHSLSMKDRGVILGYVLGGIGLLFYSFTQIDLGLVFSRFPLLYSIEQSFQYIGYFNRPLSTALYIGLLILFTSLYFYILHAIKKISSKALWISIVSLACILFVSYNAFSYDLFNYIFDAKIVTLYHENPYLHKALDYPADPMLAFMHWTHRVYPYGPVWLAVTVPLSFLGLSLFIVTLYLFKLLMMLSYLGTSYFIWKIVKKISPESAMFSTALFALNPLVLIETLVSAHNDIFMLFLMVFSLYLLLQKKTGLSVITFMLSIGTKFATGFLLPVYVLLFYKRTKITENLWNQMMILSTGLLFLAVIAVSYRTNFQPWYLLFLLPFISLITATKTIKYPVIFLSLMALGNYIPYLYGGAWTEEVMRNLFWINMISGVIGALWFSLIIRQQFKQ